MQPQAPAQRREEVAGPALVGPRLRRLLWIERRPPDEDVEAFDLVDEHDDRTAGGGDLGTWVRLEADSPPLERRDLLRVEPPFHRRRRYRGNGAGVRAGQRPATATESPARIVPVLVGMSRMPNQVLWSHRRCRASV